jgi:alkanesulfonate monooxygenase
MNTQGVSLYATCPPSNQFKPGDYLREVQQIARWSEDAGCEGILVYTNNALVDPWIASQAIISATSHLCPLVAIQPIYMHPYAAAKMISSIAFLTGRSVHLNMLAGGFTGDLTALDDHTPHDERYDRLIEYTIIIQRLLRGETVSFIGRYYTVSNLRLSPALPPELMPVIFVSGSSPAGIAAGRQLGALAVEYPKPPGEYPQRNDGAPRGIRIGIVTRQRDGDAWRVARERFPEDRKGQITHQLAMKMSDSSWHGQLARLDEEQGEDNPYWLVPFKNYKTFCPYLVGSYGKVAAELGRYMDAGYRTFILDVPHSPEEMAHIGAAFRHVESAAGAEESGLDEGKRSEEVPA